MSNKTYDVLKFIAQILIPALASLYYGLASIWHLPFGEEVVGTLSCIDVFLGAILGISTHQYNKIANSPEFVDSKGEEDE